MWIQHQHLNLHNQSWFERKTNIFHLAEETHQCRNLPAILRQSLCFKACFVQVLPRIRQCNLQPSMQPQLPALFSESNKCSSGRDAWVVEITCGQHTQEGFSLRRPKMWRKCWWSWKLEHLICMQKSLHLLLGSFLLEVILYIPSCSVKPQL